MKTNAKERETRLGMLEQNVKDGGTFHRGVLDFESRLIADVEDAVELLKEYELWEAGLILDDGAWRSDPPVLTQALQDSLIALQAKRNAFLKEPSDA